MVNSRQNSTLFRLRYEWSSKICRSKTTIAFGYFKALEHADLSYDISNYTKTVFISGKVQVFTYLECTKSNWTQFSSADIHEPIEFCAGTKDGSKDACIGDSGLEFDYDNHISILYNIK